MSTGAVIKNLLVLAVSTVVALAAGEVVVASANFLIDAESNLGGALQQLPSDGKQPPAAHKH